MLVTDAAERGEKATLGTSHDQRQGADEAHGGGAGRGGSWMEATKSKPTTSK